MRDILLLPMLIFAAADAAVSLFDDADADVATMPRCQPPYAAAMLTRAQDTMTCYVSDIDDDARHKRSAQRTPQPQLRVAILMQRMRIIVIL